MTEAEKKAKKILDLMLKEGTDTIEALMGMMELPNLTALAGIAIRIAHEKIMDNIMECPHKETH